MISRLAEFSPVLDALPFVTIIYDHTGQIMLRSGSLHRIIGRSLPSQDEKQRMRWRIRRQGEILTPEDWPSKCALRGETHINGFHAGYRDPKGGANRRFQIVSSPLTDAGGFHGGVTLLLETDSDLATGRDIALYRQPRFAKAFFQNVTTAWQSSDTPESVRALAALKRGLEN